MPWLVDEPQMFIRTIWLGGFPLRARELAGVASTIGIYLGRGFSGDEAQQIADRMFANPARALDALVRE